MATYPSFESLIDSPDSQDVMRAKRSIYSILSSCAKVIFSIAFVVIVNLAFDGVANFSRLYSGFPDISLRWLAVFPLILLLNVVRKYNDDIYIFGLHGVTQHQGRLSLNKRVPHVKYSDILSLRVRQDPWGRIFNYGDLDLDTAADAGVELIVEGVSHPEELCRLVERLRLNSLRTGMAEKAPEIDQKSTL